VFLLSSLMAIGFLTQAEGLVSGNSSDYGRP
jgi:hypothetical protein